MGPPGGGRNAVTNRYLRHFSVVSVTAFDVNSLSVIFTSLVDWWLRKYSYGASLAKLSKQLVAATLDIYLRCQKELLPTPAKSHYTYNLRDVSKVVQGTTFLASLSTLKCSLTTTARSSDAWLNHLFVGESGQGFCTG
jgi:dynein heavy chain, axonemal